MMTDYKKALMKKIVLVEMKIALSTLRERDLLEAELKMLKNDLKMCGGN